MGLRTIPLVLLAAALPMADCDGSPGARDAETDVAPDVADASGDAPPDEAEADEAGEEAPDGAPTPCARAGEARVTTVGFLSTGRYAPAAVRLRDGRVLVAGGYDFAAGIRRSAELFDPAAGTLTPTGDLRQARNFPAALPAPDGTALLFGGFHPSFGSDAKVEIYDPAAGTFRFAGNSMSVGREAHTATWLDDGRVLIAGGLQAIGMTFHASAELYDPATESFAPTAAPLNTARAFHAAARLSSGEVLLVGGDSGRGELATAERYVPADGWFWNTSGGLAHPAKAPAAAPLPDGRVLVAGGANALDGTLADAAVYDPATDRFVPTAPMAVRRMAHTLTPLEDGRVLAVGGWSDSSSPSASTGALEVYDPAAGTWTLLPVRLARPRHDHVAVRLPDCRVVVVGGQQVDGSGVPVAPVEVEVIVVPGG